MREGEREGGGTCCHIVFFRRFLKLQSVERLLLLLERYITVAEVNSTILGWMEPFPNIFLGWMELGSIFPSILLGWMELGTIFPNILLGWMELGTIFGWMELGSIFSAFC